MYNETILIANMNTGECFGIIDVNSMTTTALKRSLSNNIRCNPDSNIKVIKSHSENLKEYFIRYINKVKQYNQKECV